jgi:hypothetical protein
MKKLFYSLVAILAITSLLQSCTIEPDYKYKSQITTVGPAWGPIIKSCCYGSGTNCSMVGVEYFRSNTTLMQYVNTDNIAGFFQNENWRSVFGSLDQSLVDAIIRTNPKLIETSEGNYILVKSKTAPLDDTNVLYTFAKQIAPCDHFPE